MPVKFRKHFISALATVAKKAQKGDLDTLWNILPFMVLAGEMYADPELREGMDFLMESVNSADDVLSWVDYLALPGDGWEGDEVPLVDPFGDTSEETASLPLSWIMGEAYAQSAKTRAAAKITKQVIGGTLRTLSKQMSKADAKFLAPALKEIRKNLDDLPVDFIKKDIHKAAFLRSSAWLMARAGSKGVKNSIRGVINARFSSPFIIAMNAYLAWEVSCGVLNDFVVDEGVDQAELEATRLAQMANLQCTTNNADVVLFNEQIRNQIGIKIAAVFADKFSDRRYREEKPGNEGTSLDISGHGALFHLSQIAYYQLSHRFSGTEPIKAVDVGRIVAFFKDDTDIPDQGAELKCGGENCRSRKIRMVDIILGERSVDNVGKPTIKSLDAGETWVELKSYEAAGDKDNARYRPKAGIPSKPWTIGGAAKGLSLHKQYTLDRVALNLTSVWWPKTPAKTENIVARQTIKDIVWHFQSFKGQEKIKGSTNGTSFISPKLGSISSDNPLSVRYYLSKTPGGNDEVIKASLSTTPPDNKIKLFTMSAIVDLLVSKYGLSDLADKLTDEVADDD